MVALWSAAVDACWVRTCWAEGGADDTWRIQTHMHKDLVISTDVLDAGVLLILVIVVLVCHYIEPGNTAARLKSSSRWRFTPHYRKHIGHCVFHGTCRGENLCGRLTCIL